MVGETHRLSSITRRGLAPPRRTRSRRGSASRRRPPQPVAVHRSRPSERTSGQEQHRYSTPQTGPRPAKLPAARLQRTP